MQGDFSRTTFAAAHAYRAVWMQQGRVLLDADWNEQTSVTAHHDEVRTRDVVGRTGGPLPDDGGPGPFAVVAADGSAPAGVPWAQLVVTPGRYYVDGVLAESFTPPGGARGWSLADQPYLRRIGAGVAADPGLAEPPASADGTRYAFYLDVSEHHVTADEAAELRESALGGPDTTTRAQTTWQVRWVQIGAAEQCSDLHAPTWLARTPRTMVAALRAAEDDADPCRISSTGGFRRLENQLYRVQIHDAGAEPTFLWSRENGSVVAGLVGLATSVLPGVDAVLTLDRVGRDEELSIREADLVEVTSTDRQQRGLAGFLARAGAPDGLELPVAWVVGGPSSLASLGRAPVVRRWEGGPVRLAATAVDLEDGLTVRFPAGGEPRVGDYWTVPARTVRLAYGLSDLRGTIDWPVSGGLPAAVAPSGPPHALAPLAVLSRSGGLWTRVSDCRDLFPPLTGLTGIDLVGGDGQEDLPGEWLDQPVRVAIRRGSVPVVGVPVRFTATTGARLSAGVGAPGAGTPDTVVVDTDADGVALVRWLLRPDGDTTQTLRARRLDDHGVGTDVEVVATARLAVAGEVAWSRTGCAGFSDVTTVAGALDRLVTRFELRLRGGDGQHVEPGALVLPQPVRVIVDTPCGPFEGMPVNALATAGALVRAAEEGTPPPADLTGSGDVTADSMSGADGGALFWWQPDVSSGSDVLEIRMPGEDQHAPITVVAQRATTVAGRPGAHIVKLALGTDVAFVNDSVVDAEALATGITAFVDAPVDPVVLGRWRTVRVELELPFPIAGDGEVWALTPVGTRTVTLDAVVDAESRGIRWMPGDGVGDWLRERLWDTLKEHGLDRARLLGRFLIDGWAIPVAGGPRGLTINTHADAFVENGRVRLRLPTDDAVTGGTFEQWFWLVRREIDVVVIPDIRGLTLAEARRALTAAGIAVSETRRERIAGTVRGRVGGVEPDVGTELPDGGQVVLVVSSGG